MFGIAAIIIAIVLAVSLVVHVASAKVVLLLSRYIIK